MNAEAVHVDHLIRTSTAFMIAAIGLAQLVRPCCFVGVGFYFRRACRALSPQAGEQVWETLRARSELEGDTSALMRYVAVFYFAMAALEFVPAVPFAVPYAAASLALALAILAAYLQVKRATDRRVAPLVRRSPLDALPPVVVVAMSLCFAGTLGFALYPPYRIAALAVAISVALLFIIAWRIAGAPALLVGSDPQVAYAVDERVRLIRATGVAALACAPPAVLVMLGARQVVGFHLSGLLTAIVCAAFAVALAASVMPFGKRLVIA